MPHSQKILTEPPKKSKGTPKAAGVASARRLITAHLWWLGGFPRFNDQGEWHWTLPLEGDQEKSRIRTLNAAQLRKSVQTVNKLTRDFPRALPKIVGDVHVWKLRTQSLIGWLQPIVLENQPPPPHLFSERSTYSQATREIAWTLEKDYAQLIPLLSALSWTYYIDVQPLPKILQSIASNPQVYKHWLELNLITTVQVCHLISLEGGSFNPILHLLKRDNRLSHFMKEKTQHNIEWAGTFRIVLRESGYLVKEMADFEREMHSETHTLRDLPDLAWRLDAVWCRAWVSFITWLFRQNSGTRKQIMSLVASIDLTATLNQWREWWNHLIDSRTHIKTIYWELTKHTQWQTNPEQRLLRDQLEEVYRELTGSVPYEFNIAKFLYTVQAFVLLPRQLQSAIAQTIALLPDDPNLRLGALNHFYALSTEFPGRLFHLLSGFQEYLKVSNDAKALTPWQPAGLNHQFYGFLSEFLIEQVQPSSKISEVFRILARMHHHQDRGLNIQEVKNLWALLKLGFSVDQTVAVALLFRQTHYRGYPDPNLLNYDFLYDIPDVRLVFAKAWAPDCDEMFVKLVRALVDHNPDLVWNYLGPTFRAFQEARQGEIFRDLVVEGYWKAPRYGEYQLLFLQKVSKNDPIASGPTITRIARTWMVHYPEAFRETLEKLASIEPKAEKIASSILSRDFPDPNKITQELHHLDEKISGASEKHRSPLVMRRQNLAARLSRKDFISPQRMRTLHTKIDRAFKRAVVRHWEQPLDTRFVKEWPRFLEMEDCPPWLFEKKTLETLLPIFQLDASHQTLALRLIRVRTGKPPWDLRDDPANQRFLNLLTQRGVNIDPWINGIGTTEHRPPDGNSCFLTLEDDPLEIFQMGAHFQTCLSPGSFNYFSVFSNAADINKRVLYGRDLHGKVIGRTLLGLMNQGGLLTFDNYCHNAKSGYADAVTLFVKELAQRMQTIILSDGSIDTLVSRDWYDDGPIDLGCRFPALEEGSAFRQQLSNIDAKTLPSLLKEAFSPIPLNELTIPLVVELPEILENTKLARPLIDLVTSVNRLRLQVYLQSLRIALHAGVEDYAFSRIGKHVINGLLRQGDDVSERDLELVVQCQPGSALMLLKRTRSKGIRCWEDERYEERQTLIVQALTLLGRTKQADDLLKIYNKRK